MEVINLLLATE